LSDLRRRHFTKSKIPSHCHSIDGLLYDLSSFTDLHPGGSFWLSATVGTDCSDAFHTHHIDLPRARKALKPYLVPGRTIDNAPTLTFTWSEDDFYSALQKKVCREFKVPGTNRIYTGPTPYFTSLCFLALFLFLTSFALTAFLNSLPLAFLSGYFLYVAGYVCARASERGVAGEGF
jgi:hypothetical protein